MNMAATQEVSTEAAPLREQLRTFHLTGQGLDGAKPAGALQPTILASLHNLPDLEACFPVCIHPANGGARPLRDLVHELEHAGIITSAFHIAMHEQPGVLIEDIAEEAIASLVECSKPEIARLRKLLPPGAYLVSFHADSLPLLHAAALAEARLAQRTAFWDDVRHTAARLREILLLDEAHAPGAISTESVSASLGSRVSSFFKSALLAQALQRTANPLKRMDAERRSRCETTLAMLEEGIHDAANQPAFWLFHAGIFGATSAPSNVINFRGEARFAVDGFAAALQFCDSRLDRLTHLLRALRVARLEIDSTFDPQVHEEMLARFDWQSASAAELAALPPIMVVETSDYFGQASLTSFGKLLRSGRPVQVLILHSGVNAEDLNEFTPDFGYLSIAHRESFVLQSSLAEPSHLLSGLDAMAKTLRPAVAVVSVPRREDEERDGWLEECMLVMSQALPLYLYNPDCSPRWAGRFRLAPARHHDGATTVHAAAVSNHLSRHFRLVAPAQWNSDQMELAQYLEAYTDRPTLAVPYIWVEDKTGGQQRALLTRDLVNFCVDRRRAWALFEELAEVAKPQPAPDESARQEGAREAIQRVIAMLNVA
jgi:hypothetical protein